MDENEALDWLSEYANRVLPPPNLPGPPQSVRGWLHRVAAVAMAYGRGPETAERYQAVQDVLHQAEEFIHELAEMAAAYERLQEDRRGSHG